MVSVIDAGQNMDRVVEVRRTGGTLGRAVRSVHALIRGEAQRAQACDWIHDVDCYPHNRPVPRRACHGHLQDRAKPWNM